MVEERCTTTRHRALILDDDADSRQQLANLLEMENLDVTVVDSGTGAWNQLRAAPPCLVFVNVTSACAEGLTLCRALTRSGRAVHTPVVLLSSRFESGEVETGEAVGATDYVRVPFDPNELRFRVRSLIRRHESQVAEHRDQEHVALLANATHDAIVLLDGEHRITHFNEAAVHMFGYAESETIGRYLHELVAPGKDLAAFEVSLVHHEHQPEKAPGQTRLQLSARRKSGAEFPVELSLARTTVNGAPGTLAVIRDVTGRVLQELRLRTRQSELLAILAIIPVGLAVVGLDRRVRWANPAMLSLVGAEAVTELSELPCHKAICLAPDGACPILDQHKVVELQEVSLARRRGAPVVVLKSIYTVNLDEEPVLLEVFVDLTARKQLEAELVQARKLEAVGQLAAGIAHEINTPTQYAFDNTAFLGRGFAKLVPLLKAYQALVEDLENGPLDPKRAEAERALFAKVKLPYLIEEIPRAISEAQEGLGRIAAIVRAMKDFSHPSAGVLTPVDLGSLIATAITVSRNEWKYAADVVTDFSSTLGPVPCLRDELGQVILNLIVNAAHAIGEANQADPSNKGTITISTRDAGASAEIIVRDTGCGIPESAQSRVFEPFFTTKVVGKGTGQGLAIAYSVVVDKHRGTIRFETELGVGTAFFVTIPKTLPG